MLSSGCHPAALANELCRWEFVFQAALVRPSNCSHLLALLLAQAEGVHQWCAVSVFNRRANREQGQKFHIDAIPDERPEGLTGYGLLLPGKYAPQRVVAHEIVVI